MGRLTVALLRLNEWMSEEHANRVIFNLRNVDASGLVRNRAVHECLAYGMPLTVDSGGRQETPTVRFFDFDHPEPGVGLNEYVVTTSTRFNPRPARRPGATSPLRHALSKSRLLFQSSPGPKAGRYNLGLDDGSTGLEFQSSPGPKAGRYQSVGVTTVQTEEVSILARPEGRALLVVVLPRDAVGGWV